MAFPNTVVASIASGIPGEISFDVPSTVITAVVNTATAANNQFGRAFTYADSTVETVQAGGTGVFAGIAVNPKAHGYANLGDAEAMLLIGNVGEFLQEGEVYVELLAGQTGVIGADVYFVNATGEIGVGTAATGQTQINGGTIARHNISTGNPQLAVIRIKP